MKNTKQIMEQTNITIEGMNTEILENKLMELSKKNPNIKDLYERNQFSFMIKFFSEPIMDNGTYIKDAHLKDLAILYYIDYYLKGKISKKALAVERYLNVAIINCHRENKISITTGDEQRTFKDVFRWFQTNLSNKEKHSVIQKMNKTYNFKFKKIHIFEKDLERVANLRNFCLHHYSVVSFQYASKIKNGKAHKDKNGMDVTLNETMNSLSKFLGKYSTQSLVNDIYKILKKFKFSSKGIKLKIFKEYSKLLNLSSLKNNKKSNIHFSVIDLLKDEYGHAKQIKK